MLRGQSLGESKQEDGSADVAGERSCLAGVVIALAFAGIQAQLG